MYNYTFYSNVRPTAQPHRRIPFHVRKIVEEDKLQELENDDIIEKVEGPTPWVSQIVTPPTPGLPDEIRLCIVVSGPYKAMQRERHIIPTIELDHNQGYHQIMLDEAYIKI